VRSRTAKRRRHVMAVLSAGLASAVSVAVATGSVAAWWAVFGLLPLLCTYLAILSRARRLLAEREMNVAFFGAASRALIERPDPFALGRPQAARAQQPSRERRQRAVAAGG
jgi:hypothetical protein